MRRLLLFLLLLPTASAYILLYSKGFSADAYVSSGDTYVDVMGPQQIAEFIRSLGFQVQLSDSLTNLKYADAVIVLGCTDISERDARALVDYVRSGGGLVADLFCPTPLEDVLGVIREKTYTGGARGTLDTEYGTISGYVVASPITSKFGPVYAGYERMYYTGPELWDSLGRFNAAFSIPVAYWGDLGKGRVFVTGCLLCASPLLWSNVLDWITDGRIDFPPFKVERTVSPLYAYPGQEITDKVRVYVSDGLEAEMEYAQENTEGGCTYGRSNVDRGEEDGWKYVELTAYYTAEGKGCRLRPVHVRITWDRGMETWVKEFVVPGKYVSVVEPGPTAQYVPWWVYVAAGGFFLTLVLFLVRRGRKTSKKALLRKQLRLLRAREEEIKEAISELGQHLMRRRITEEEYRDLHKQYHAELLRIRARIRRLERALSGESEEEKKDKGEQGEVEGEETEPHAE